MKVRSGFVSNSSTSSFICDVCGEVYAERDACISDAEMFECENGHTICNSHMVNENKYDELEDPNDYEVPAEFCPVCQLEKITDRDLIVYLINKSTFKDRIEVEKIIKNEFKNYEQFQKYIESFIEKGK